MRNRVWLAQCPDYGQSLEEKIEKAFDALQVWDKIRPRMKVVLKPNLVMSSKPEQAIITHPAFTAAVGKCVQKAGGRVVIAESPGGPYTPAAMKAMFRATGYRDMAEACGFALYTDCKSREVTLPQAKRCRELSVVEPFLDRDYLINLPKLKTHSMVGFSGAVKNLFGTVPGLQKPELHCRFPEREPFSEMLCDLCHFLGPDLSLMDGIWAMDGNGPTGGQRRDLHVIAGSESPWALDVAAASLVGLEPEKITMLREGHERGYGPLDLSELELVGDPMETLLAPDFLKAEASSTDFIDRLPKFLRPAAKKLATPYPRIDKKRCVGCGKCAESCPQHTISLRDGKAVIRYQNCIRCFCCHEMCPKHVVQIKRLGLLRL